MFLHLIRYGVPPMCRPCPLGCRCPGGDRCHADPGFYARGEGTELGTAFAPTRCAAPALQRCPGYSAAQGTTPCGAGYTGGACTICEVGYHRESSGVCAACASTSFFGALVLPLLANIAVAALSFGFLVLIKFILIVHSAALDADDNRPSSELWRPALVAALAQALAMVVTTVGSLQIAASVSAAAIGKAPPVLAFIHAALATLRFELPLTHIGCITPVGSSDGALTAAWVGELVGIALALVALAQSVPWLRAEQLFFGWKSCSTAGSQVTDVICPWLRLRGTPILRFALSTILLIIYVPVVHAALSTLICHSAPTVEVTVTWSLAKYPHVACFSAEHIAVAIIGTAALLILGLAWPLLTVVSLAHRFALRAMPCDAPIERCNACVLARCDRVEVNDETRVPVIPIDNASEVTAASTATRQLIELGIVKRRAGKDVHGPELVEQRLAEKGLHGRAYHPFLRTRFESHFFWMIAVRLYGTLLISFLGSVLATATPTVGTAIALFLTTNAALLAYAALTLGLCPFRHGARWHMIEVPIVCVIAALLSLSNLAMAIGEVGKSDAADVDLEWMIVPVEIALMIALIVCTVLMLLAYFASGTMGCLHGAETQSAILLKSFVDEREVTRKSSPAGSGLQYEEGGGSIELKSGPFMSRRSESASIDALFQRSVETMSPLNDESQSDTPTLSLTQGHSWPRHEEQQQQQRLTSTPSVVQSTQGLSGSNPMAVPIVERTEEEPAKEETSAAGHVHDNPLHTTSPSQQQQQRSSAVPLPPGALNHISRAAVDEEEYSEETAATVDDVDDMDHHVLHTCEETGVSVIMF